MSQQPNSPYEKRDIYVKLLVNCGIALFLFVIIAAILMIPLTKGTEKLTTSKDPLVTNSVTREIPEPSPTLEVHYNLELKKHQYEMKQKVESFGWIDSDNKIVRTPVDFAMQQVLEKGLPARNEK